MKKPQAVALVSGGMDSCVTVAIARKQYDVAAVHVRYGQKTQAREEQAFVAVTDHFGVNDKMVIDLAYLHRIGGSSLTDPRIPVADAVRDRPGIPTSYVPFRNAHLLSIATSWAEIIGAEKIFIGVVEQDSSGYPDCSGDFITTFNQAIRFGTKPETKIEIVAPLIDMKKSEIVRLGNELNAPFHLTWSCYRDSFRACGLCDSCVLRMRGFQEAGIIDPISYAL